MGTKIAVSVFSAVGQQQLALLPARSENFAQGFTEALIEYALGRPYGFTDEELASTIVKQARAKNFTLREFIVALVQSPLFQRK